MNDNQTKLSKVKASYNIPFTLNNSRGDAVFIFWKYAISVRVMGFVFILVALNILLKKLIPPLAHGGLIGPGICLLGLDIIAYLLFANRIKTGLSGFRLFNIARNHLTRFQSQTLELDKSALLQDVKDYIPFKEVTKEGVLIFNDNSKGMLIPIIGYASKNMFDSGKIASVMSFETAMRTIDDNAIQYYLTLVSGQNVKIQVNELLRKYNEEADPILKKWLREEIQTLTNYVDGQFSTLHQYMLIRYASPESYENSIRWLRNLLESDSMAVIKYADVATQQEVIDVLKLIFSPSKDEATIIEMKGDNDNT